MFVFFNNFTSNLCLVSCVYIAGYGKRKELNRIKVFYYINLLYFKTDILKER